MSAAPILSVRGLGKRYGDTTVLRDVSFDLYPGDVMALIGENGAGKSTTKGILCGLVAPSAGEIRVDGEIVEPSSGRDLGISAVHQELSLFGSLTVTENLCIRDLPGHAARIDWRAADRMARHRIETLGIDIDPDATVETMGAGQQQIVEIGKALINASRVLILDEPTTSLTAPERERLFRLIEDLRERGMAVIFISHFMEEIYRVCQSYIVLRDGEQVGGGALADMPQRKLEELMGGAHAGRCTARHRRPGR